MEYLPSEVCELSSIDSSCSIRIGDVLYRSHKSHIERIYGKKDCMPAPGFELRSSVPRCATPTPHWLRTERGKALDYFVIHQRFFYILAARLV